MALMRQLALVLAAASLAAVAAAAPAAGDNEVETLRKEASQLQLQASEQQRQLNALRDGVASAERVQARKDIVKLKEKLMSIEEKQAEEEGELDVLKAKEKDLTEQLQALRRDGSEEEPPSLLQMASVETEEADADSSSDAASRLEAFRAQLQETEVSLAQAKSSSEVSQQKLAETSQELSDVQTRVAELQQLQDGMKQEAAKKDAVLAETHQMLTSPLVAEASAMGLQPHTPVLVQLASQETELRTQQATALEQKLASAKKAEAQQRAAAEQQRQELKRVQGLYDEAVASQHVAEVAHLKKKNMVLLETLRSTARADKAEHQRASAESKRLEQSVAAKAQALHQQREEYQQQRGMVAAAQAAIEQQRAHREQKQAEVEQTEVVFQQTKEKLQAARQDATQLEQGNLRESIEVGEVKQEQAPRRLQLIELQSALEKRKKAIEDLNQQLADTSKKVGDAESALEREKLHGAAKDVEGKLGSEVKKVKEKTKRSKLSVSLLQNEAGLMSQGRVARYAAKTNAAEEQRAAAMVAFKAKLNAEAQAKEASLKAKTAFLADDLHAEQQREQRQVDKTNERVAFLETKLAEVKADEEQKLKAQAQSATELEAELLSDQKELEAEILENKREVLQLQNQGLEIEDLTSNVQKEVDEANANKTAAAERLKAEKAQEKHDVARKEAELSKVEFNQELAMKAEKKRSEEVVEDLKHQIQVESTVKKEEKITDIRRQMEDLDADRDQEEILARAAAELKQKEARLTKVRSFLAKEEEMADGAKAQLRALRRDLQQHS